MTKLTAQNIHKNKIYKKGFTLIELLIVVSILGILAGLTINVINPTRQRNVAEDGVRRANMEKVAQSLESFVAGEGRPPTSAEKADLNSTFWKYIKTWPAGRDGATFTYAPYPVATPPTKFQVYVYKTGSTTAYIVYNSDWGKIMECTAIPTLGVGDTATTSCTNL
jgi:prepilin-type N-terminal cleavage/methylation domain-containing protein